MKLGLGSYALAWGIGVSGYPSPQKPLGTVDFIRKAKALDLTLVQIADNIPLHILDAYELKEIKETAKGLGIEVEIGTRGTDPDHLSRYLELADFFEAKLVRTIITANNIGEAEEDLAKVLPLFKKQGVMLGVENHDRHTTDQFTELFQNLNHPNIGVCIDTVNSFGALEGPKQVINHLSPYIVNVHFKDFEIHRLDHMMGFILTGTPAGEGMLKMEWLLGALKKERKDVNIILEQWPPFTQTIEETILLEEEWLVQSVDYLREKVGTAEPLRCYLESEKI